MRFNRMTLWLGSIGLAAVAAVTAGAAITWWTGAPAMPMPIKEETTLTAVLPEIRFGSEKVSAQVKPDKEWKDYDTRTMSQPSRSGYSANQQDKYGGRTDRSAAAKGFFYATNIDGRWWLVDPEGHLFIHKGVVSVAPGASPAITRALLQTYGIQDKWAEATVKLLRDHGFNGTGAWTNTGLLRKTTAPVVYTQMWNFMSSYGKERGGTFQQPGHTGYPNDAIFVFDPQFAEFADRYAKQLAVLKDDPYLLGHFSDNELPFPSDLLDKYLKLNPNDPGYKAALEWAAARKKVDAAQFSKQSVTDQDRKEFIGYVADTYYSIVSRAIKKYDPNHLYLGSRIHTAKDNRYLFAAAGKHLDAVSINYYGVWTPTLSSLHNWEQWSGKPVMITEWYTKGMDAGLPNQSGAGWNVKTQEDRGKFYQQYALALLESKAVVGWHWFKYIDNDPEDKEADPSNRDSNKGIVTIKYEPYKPLLDRMKTLNDSVYDLIDYFDAGK
ncbi:hypothetical protein PAESOLCIP111_03400 [Paenibacillus solanacearum]|uniref:Agarase n=1 Tax=Paenibacillus solanacearum TaxID=2048548 RepID=A0A916K2G4_9BACL|nr:hypothetical protein [Paenibacillus solanacearum]CAG7632644.1 hypothetical protein PAESOLCIP111_03400 [Paenibacillus solanacearum]